MIGKIVNERYEILERLGQGGMATVYRAKDLNLGREVAIKILHESIANDPDFRERFRREARAASVLNNPNIVQVYDFMESPEGIYIVMELVRGEDLRTMLKRGGRLSLDRSLSVILDVLSALQEAHRHGLVHRDISARNVLIGDNDGVKVSDFGIARVMGERTLTQAGELIGSVEYISPEQANGEEAEFRSDIYSVGVLLYQLLTGVLPFTADSAVKLAMRHIQDRPHPPSELRPEISKALDDIVMCALAKDPQDRFESAAAMIEALDSLRYAPGDEDDDDDFVTVVRPAGWNQQSEEYEEDSSEYRPVVDDSTEERAPAKKKGKTIFMVGMLMTVFVAVVAGITWTLVFSVPRTEVINIEGEPVDRAIAALEQLGFKTNIQEQRAVEGLAEGIVIEQNPKAGTQLAQGSVVYLVVSRSKDSVYLPDFRSMELARVVKELERLGLQANIVHSDDASYPPNTVIGQAPAAGNKVARGSTITLTVSSSETNREVPNLVGMELDAAMKLIAKIGAVAVVKEINSSEGTPNMVLRQVPEAGTKVERGTKVEVYVAKSTRGTAVMPALIGKTVAAARAEAQALGLELIVEGGGDANAKVVSQRPDPGDVVEDGKAYVSGFSMAVVPNLNGVNYSDAVEELRAAGLKIGNVGESYEDNVPGLVVQQYPAGGMEVEYGSTVDITVTAQAPVRKEPEPSQYSAPAPETPSAPAPGHELPSEPTPVGHVGESAPPTPALNLPGDLPIN